MIEETTIMYPKKYRLRFRYFESGHTCGIKVKPQNRNRRITCDCSVYSNRVTRKWYKPIMWLGNRAEYLIYKLSKLKSKANPYVVEPYGTWLWWIRRNITLD